MQLAKPADVDGHLPVHAFQGIDRLPQLEHALDGLTHLAEGLFHGQGLVPILQHIRKHVLRQLQAVIQGHEGQGLSLAAAVDRALERELPEDGDVAAAVQGFEPHDLLTIGQGEGGSQIAAAMGVEKGAQRLPAQAQGQVPQTAFDAMHGQGFVQGGRQELHHLGHQVLQQFGLEKRQFLCDAHGRASLSMDKASRARTTLSQGGPLGYQSSGRN